MAKVFGIHMITLRPGVDEQEFEKFVAEEMYPLYGSIGPSGWEFYLLKGDTGDREGKYLWLWEIESLEALRRIYPSPNELSEEGQQWFESHPELAEILEKWSTFSPSVPGENTIYTDYVVVGK